MKVEQGTVTVEKTLDGAKIAFLTKDYSEVDELLNKSQKTALTLVITSHRRNKRSLDANSFFWTLADKVGEKVGLSKEEVYREMIHDVGVFEDIAIVDEAVEEFTSAWEAKGTGWIAEVQPDCKIPRCTKIRCYKGSSTYNTKQMSRLIDRLVEEAKTLGVETLTPNEIERIKQLWN